MSMGFTHRYGLFGICRPTGSMTDGHDTLLAAFVTAADLGIDVATSPSAATSTAPTPSRS